MIKVLIHGCNGKMGQEVQKQLDNYEDFILVAGFDQINNGNFTFPVYTDFTKISEIPDVIIDFSVPFASLKMLEYATEKHIPVVIATTGFTKEDDIKILEFSKNIPIFKSANMSFDINLMSKILTQVAKELPDSDIEIVETHHNRKIDSPSGTAILLANSINNALDNTLQYDFDRMQKKEKRSKKEIGFSSIRGGNIVGEHSVMFFSEHETFEITHKAYSRSIFADGSIKAAKFIVDKQNGLFSMNDLIQ
ncbi:MAG: 4-hydroxy-tetrahydrodipicolinate reductase [Clostridiaceae bacterium]|nr:4-hydroxy-tetrahydrodipicolinate reductase [Clostridiaceae bacterium]